MKRELLPYYISRAIVSIIPVVILLASGMPWWFGLLVYGLTFAAFLWYAHSGHYLIDTSTPLTPLRRDKRGESIRDRAVTFAVMVGGVSLGVLSLLSLVADIPFESLFSLALFVGMVAYYIKSTWLHRNA